MAKLTPKKLQAEADAATDAARRYGEEWAAKAQNLVEDGAEWIAPRAQHLWDETVKATAPVIEEAAERVRPYLDEAQEKASEYAKRGEEAARAAQKAARKDGTLAERARRAGEATREELTKPKKSSHKVAKVFGWTLVGIAAAGAGYVLWRRSQPVEDPWAEEYWADLDTDVDIDDVPVEEPEDSEEPEEEDK